MPSRRAPRITLLLLRRRRLLLLLAAPLSLAACRSPREEPAAAAATSDSAFAALQQRGHKAMGVDQYTSSHRFDPLPDGGRIELQRDSVDSAGIAQIREHLRGIARAFDAGDFATPSFVHATDSVPGTRVMTAKRDAITYTFAPLPRGGEVRIRTTDPEAVRAVHEFLAFQRGDHRVH